MKKFIVFFLMLFVLTGLFVSPAIAVDSLLVGRWSWVSQSGEMMNTLVIERVSGSSFTGRWEHKEENVVHRPLFLKNGRIDEQDGRLISFSLTSPSLAECNTATVEGKVDIVKGEMTLTVRHDPTERCPSDWVTVVTHGKVTINSPAPERMAD